jgi:threonine dehydratase
MVGGRNPVADERLFYFEFSERPGTRMNFFNKIGNQRNISLFHYRNHGADYGRVLAGIQIPDADYAEFISRLETIGYPFRDETENPVYRLFLV